jgi:SnoaL-like domain
VLERRLPFFCLARPLRVSLLAATALLGAPSCTPPEAPRTASPAAIRSELEAVNLSMTEAFNRGDRVAAARHYADDARILGPGGERVSGREAIDAYWARFRQGSRWRLEVLEAGGDRDAPWQLGRSTHPAPKAQP